MDREQEMSAKRVVAARADLTGRMAALERRVVGTAEGIADAARDTVSSVRSTIDTANNHVQHAMGTTADGVRDVLNVRKHMRERPWAGVGLAAVTGFLAGFLPRGGSRSATWSSAIPGTPSAMGEIWSLVRRELVGLGETALLAASAAAKQSVHSLVAHYQADDRSGPNRNGGM